MILTVRPYVLSIQMVLLWMNIGDVNDTPLFSFFLPCHQKDSVILIVLRSVGFLALAIFQIFLISMTFILFSSKLFLSQAVSFTFDSCPSSTGGWVGVCEQAAL